MQRTTQAISPSQALLRLDPLSGKLRERRYSLEVLTGPEAGQSLELTGRQVIGSHPDASLTLTDPTVSRQHVELEARADGVHVKDLSSTNGTFVGGARIESLIVESELQLTIGKTQVKITTQDQEADEPQAISRFGRAVASSAVMQRLFGVLERVAQTDSTVLLLGETGTGKELLAEGIHQASPRSGRPLVVVDCGSVAPTLIESELFGHAKGAFTGASGMREGAFLEANGGTIFLDELGELPLELQPKLLRVLESGTIKRVGEDKTRQVNVRVIAATHRDLKKEIEAGRFRQDLYYRLAVVPVVIPPLRERREDVPILVDAIVRYLGSTNFDLSPVLLEKLQSYDWPGNVRELRNVVERALSGADLDPSMLEDAPRAPGAPGGASSVISDAVSAQLSFKEAKEKLVESFTREYLSDLLRRCNGNISQAARSAGLARNHIYNLVTKYGLKPQDD